MNIDQKDIEQYLSEVKEAVEMDNYRDVTLLERYGTEERIVSLYIKFNKLENCFVIVISFHEQKHPVTYYFR